MAHLDLMRFKLGNELWMQERKHNWKTKPSKENRNAFQSKVDSETFGGLLLFHTWNDFSSTESQWELKQATSTTKAARLLRWLFWLRSQDTF